MRELRHLPLPLRVMPLVRIHSFFKEAWFSRMYASHFAQPAMSVTKHRKVIGNEHLLEPGVGK
jgi:hypothetical protein